ncbi:MAG: arginine N-succinyltransferase [Parachlamydiaceae bacterium]|nr:arginine N-succinyltransferase [Parachlamydiaceae bacterium]
MHIIRPIEERDEDSLIQLANHAKAGLPTLPRDSNRLKVKLVNSLKAFSATAPFIRHEQYFFVLENLETDTIEGCCAIHTSTKSPIPNYYYSLETIRIPRRSLDLMSLEHELLFPQAHEDDSSKICTLYLSAECRKSGLGRLLSLSRFLFIACHPERFEKKMTSEMRGVLDPSGKSPFWEAIGRHFCDIDCDILQSLYETERHIAGEIIPHFPIYCILLPKDAQEAIGQVHSLTSPAMKMLYDEGFQKYNVIDVFDGGPHLMASTDNIRTIKTSKKVIVKAIVNERETNKIFEHKLLSNTKLNFRACHQEICLEDEEKSVILNKATADALMVEPGDEICYNTLRG